MENKKNMKGFKLWLSGKPTRSYYQSGSIFCPKCPKSKYDFDKEIYASKVCKECGAEMKERKTFNIIYSGKAEMEIIK